MSDTDAYTYVRYVDNRSMHDIIPIIFDSYIKQLNYKQFDTNYFDLSGNSSGRNWNYRKNVS